MSLLAGEDEQKGKRGGWQQRESEEKKRENLGQWWFVCVCVHVCVEEEVV